MVLGKYYISVDLICNNLTKKLTTLEAKDILTGIQVASEQFGTRPEPTVLKL